MKVSYINIPWNMPFYTPEVGEKVDANDALIFRISIAVLLLGLELLASLTGKLIHERSETFYSYFCCFCGGVLLSKGLFCGLFDALTMTTESSPQYTLTLFSLSFVILAACHMALSSNGYQYSPLSVSDDHMDDADEEEELGIELGMLPSASSEFDDDDDDDDIREDEHRFESGSLRSGPSISPSVVPTTTSSPVSFLWTSTLLSMTILGEGATGLLLGSTYHQNLSAYGRVFVQCILVCLVCGSLMENNIHQSGDFLRLLVLIILALPFGLLVGGNLLIDWLKFSADQLVAYGATVYPIVAGAYTAGAVLYMIPACGLSSSTEDEGKNAWLPLRHLGERPGYLEVVKGVLSNPVHLRAMSFVFGYFIMSLSQNYF
eukprot:scaffold360_cov186-Ochromonas_danica.AAC.2